MSAKRGLGKGLDSMIPEKVTSRKEEKEQELNVSRETLIAINEIEPNKGQPRKIFNEDSIQELADSIKQYGIIQPLLLQKKKNYYEIIAGERRWRAARLAGLKQVPAIIKNYSPQEVVEIALIENIQREDLNPIEEAIAYQNLMNEFKLKQDEVAERVSKSRTAVTNAMRLLKLDLRVQQMIIDEMLTVGHARPLISIDNHDKQYEVALKVFDSNLSVRDTEKLVKKLLESKEEFEQEEKTSNDDFIYKDLENRLTSIVGTKVVIHKKVKNKGKIEIEYYSGDELERLIEMFESLK